MEYVIVPTQRGKKQRYENNSYFCNMLILGIDPGSRLLGYSLLQYELHEAPKLVLMDVLNLTKIVDFQLRLRMIFDTTVRIIDSHHPHHLAIEAPFVGKSVQSMIKLGKAQGVAIAAALSRNLSFSEHQPTAVKQRVTGNGNATKEQVAAVVQSVFNLPQQPRHFDATDSLAVAYTCFMEQTDPLKEIRSDLRRSSHQRSHRASWGDFVQTHPELCNG